MKNENLNLKVFIKGWNFANPNWKSLPPNFPNLPNSGLTREESHLLGAIKTAWVISGKGRRYYLRKVTRVSTLTVFVLITLITLISLITNGQSTSKEVSAKTVSRTVNNIVEATRSAIFRK